MSSAWTCSSAASSSLTMPPAETAVQSRGVGVAARAVPSWHYRAFGLTWSSTFRLPIAAAAGDVDADVALRLCEDVDALWSGAPRTPEDWLFKIDGRRFVVQRGRAGDFRLVQQEGVRFHVDREATSVACEPAAASDPASQRLLLDTVLWTTALLRGLEGLHAGAVRTAVGVVAFLGGSGGGKTSLTFELVSRGYPLFSDDVLILERRNGGFVVHPAPPLMNLPVAASIGSAQVDPIARIGDESWVSVANVAKEQSLLVHLFVLHRAAGLGRRIVDTTPTALDLLPTCSGARLRRLVGTSSIRVVLGSRARRSRLGDRRRRRRLAGRDRRSRRGRPLADGTVVSRLGIVTPLVEEAAEERAQSALLGLVGVSKKWGPLRVLDDVSLDVHRGEIISVEGANGVGKTTMLRIVVGMILPDAGSVALDGLHPERNRREYLRRVGFLSAGDRALYPRLTARRQLRFAAGIALIPKQDQETFVVGVIDMFGLGKLADRRADRMSTGQRQRLRLAMSLVHRPSLVVLDEPTNSLDEEGLDILGAYLLDLSRRGGAAIWAAPAARTQAGLPSDRGLRLESGKLVDG